MHRLPLWMLITTVIAGLAYAAPLPAAAIVTPDQQAAMLAAHNKLRREVATAETLRLGRTVTIPDLTWNAAAATSAQAWADHLAATRTLDHNPARGALGETIAAFENSGPFPEPNPTSVDMGFALWKSEAPDYNWDTNSCVSVCGHYTQVIWASSTSVGCGAATGSGVLIPGGYRTVWVCHYAPSGNEGGARPYEPAAAAAPTPPRPAATPTPPAASNTDGGFVGGAPGAGLVGLLVTSRVSSAAGLVSALSAGGCTAASIAVLEAGTWKVYVVGAPAVVNSTFPASLPSATPFFVRCAA